jgi:hypothetical protein
MEAVNGKVVGGKDGHFEVDIPLYSARPFLHRGIFQGPDLSVQVMEWKPNRLSLQAGNGFPASAKQVWARRNDVMLELKQDGSAWVWEQRTGPERGFILQSQQVKSVQYLRVDRQWLKAR